MDSALDASVRQRFAARYRLLLCSTALPGHLLIFCGASVLTIADVNEGGAANCPPEERLPAAMDSTDTIRDKFARMGLSTRQQVALMGVAGPCRCCTPPDNRDAGCDSRPATAD